MALLNFPLKAEYLFESDLCSVADGKPLDHWISGLDGVWRVEADPHLKTFTSPPIR